VQDAANAPTDALPNVARKALHDAVRVASLQRALDSRAFNTPFTAPVATSVPGTATTAFDALVNRGKHTNTKVSGLLHPAFEAKLDTATQSRVHAENNVRPLFDGANSFAERNELISRATSSIHLQTFIFTDDDTGWDLARRLAERSQAGVEVRVIVDALGSNRSSQKIFDFMRAAGVDVREYKTGLDLLSVNDRWHEKHLIVDGKVAVEGGMNIADEYSLGGSGRLVFRDGKPGMQAWRDTDVRIEGPAVADIQRAFLRNWALLGEPVPEAGLKKLFPGLKRTPGGDAVRVVQHHPNGNPPDDNTLQLYLHAINASTKSITIENAYFIPPKELRDALIAAAKRGVQVSVMTNSKQSSDMGFVVDAARHYYAELIAAGVRIFEVQGGTLHSKTSSFDGEYSIIGSCNLNGRSDGRDTESVCAVRSKKLALQLEARFVEGALGARYIGLLELAERSTISTLKGWALSTVAWTL
jgi:cardiolipin synthase